MKNFKVEIFVTIAKGALLYQILFFSFHIGGKRTYSLKPQIIRKVKIKELPNQDIVITSFSILLLCLKVMSL
jgi:hypothetical protein